MQRTPPIRETKEDYSDLPACAVCGTTERHTAHLDILPCPVDVLVAVNKPYIERWPGCLFEGKGEIGWKLIGTHACNHEQPEEEHDNRETISD